MRSRILALISIAVLFTCACDALPPLAKADVGNVTYSAPITATGVTPWLPLGGQNNCVFSIVGAPVGLTLVPQVATDPAYQSVTTASAINSGSISGAGIFNGSVATLQPTAIRANVTGYTSGATQLNIVCGPGGGTGGGGGGGTVTQGSPNTLPNAWPMYFAPGGIPTSGVTMTNVTTDTSCTQISLTALSWGTGWINGSSTQQAQTIALYNSNTCTTPIWGPQALNAGANFLNLIPLSAYSSGVWVKASGSLTGTVLLFWL